ncbi:MAG: hypothetical protein PVH19_04805 [Planctomycetia bacterium]|jgi:hypothetical protein
MNDQLQNPSQPPERLYELLEVLRPDAGECGDGAQQDAAREELAELLEKNPRLIETWHEIARVDDLLCEAVQDVAVPTGLPMRILDSLQHKQRRASGRSSEVPRFSRMRLIASALAVSILVAGGIVWWFAANNSNRWNEDQVLSVASNYFTQETPASARDFSSNLTKEDRELLRQYVPSEDVLKPDTVTWEVAGDFLGRRAVVYRFEDRHGNRAALFVVQQDQSVTGLLDRPPRRPRSMTGGRSAGAWQSDGLLYVLVSSGDERTWRSLLVPARPVT